MTRTERRRRQQRRRRAAMQRTACLALALLAVAAAGGIYALAAHKTIKTRIPFVPCIMAVYFIMLVIKAVKGDDII